MRAVTDSKFGCKGTLRKATFSPMKFSTLLITCSSALLFAACSSEAKLSLGIDGSTKVSEITPEQAMQLCANTEETAKAFAEENVEGLCALSGALVGAFSGGDAAACETARTACQAAEQMTNSECNAEMTASNCEATIEEVETCFNEALAATRKVLKEFGSMSCSELLASDSQATLEADNPQSCRDLEAKCPEFQFGTFSGTGTSTST